MLLRLLLVPAPLGKLEMLPRPGLRVFLAPVRESEVRFSMSLTAACTGAGVGVGVGESSDAVVGGGGGLEVPEELALVVPETGESLGVPLVA